MTTTLVGYFDDYSEARQTEQDLLTAGFTGNEISVVFQPKEATEEESRGIWERLKSAFRFAGEEDRRTYEEAARHGGAILTVSVTDQELDDAATIIERHHPVDLDDRMGQWRSAGAPSMVSGAQAEAAEAAKTETIPVTEQELQIGRRLVQRGGVRIHTYTTEIPVEQEVALREERAVVERRPTNRPAEAGEQAFQERTIEVQEMGEEPVIAKETRVVEEIAVGKEQTQRTEKVRDTVKRTEVDVERTPGKKP